MDRFEIRLSGAGGQGMILAGIILAEAALEEDGLNVSQTQSYGPESRGGASRAEVVISRQLIDFPKVMQPDILVALTQEAFDKYSHDIKENGVIIVDEEINTDGYSNGRNRITSLPILRKAEEETGLKLTANIVVLGIIDRFINDIKTDSLKKAVTSRVPSHTIEKNLKAFEVGRILGQSSGGIKDVS